MEYKQQLSELEKNDPEFFKYLKEADEELLQFSSVPDAAQMDTGNAAGKVG